MVKVSPTPPRMTSWCATNPRIRNEWIGTPSTTAPRAPSSAVTVASGAAGVPAAERAWPMPMAVWRAVPDGASALSG